MPTPQAKRIFIVEDEAIVAADLGERLNRLGYLVAGSVASGAKAIDQVARIRPDLVLMDIILQGDIDGVAAAERILAEHEIPVVFLTAHADNPTMKRAQLTGPYGYVLKPFDERELRVAVEIALYRAQIEAALRQANHELADAMAQIKTLQGLLPICAWCKKIRDDDGYWQMLEAYITSHTTAQFTHCICPECLVAAKKKIKSNPRAGAETHPRRHPPRAIPEA